MSQHEKLRDLPEKRPGDDLHVPPLSSPFRYNRANPASPAQASPKKEEEKSGVLAFMSQNTRERSFGVVTRERISIAMEPYSHKIEELDRNLESAIGAVKADVRGICKVWISGLGVYI
jgi:hypothetical protein